MQTNVIINERAFQVLIEDGVSSRIRKILPAIARESQRRFLLPESGRFYSRGRKEGGGRAFRGGSRYRASAKGEAPAVRSGRLFNSIKEEYPSKLTGVLTFDTPYSAYLEPPAPLDRPFALVSAETVAAQFNQSLSF